MAAIGNLQHIGFSRKQFHHEGIVLVFGLLEPIELLLPRRFLFGLVPARAYEIPERLHERRIHRLNTQNYVEVLRGPEFKSGAGHRDIAGGAADEHIPVRVVLKMVAEYVQPSYHRRLLIISSREA